MWYFNGNEFAENGFTFRSSPLITTIGWGVGLAFHYASAYLSKGIHSIESEYEKLKNKQQ